MSEKMSSFTLRDAQPGDLETIVAFNLALARDTENISLDPQVLRAGVTRLLADPAKGFYVVATDGARVIGQIMVTFEWSDWRDGNWWWLQSVYVAPDARRRGVFRALFEEVRARANRQDVCGLRLYVERENHVAQGTYSGLGMKRAPYFVYQLGQE